MGSFKATVTNYPNGVVSIESLDSTSYESILQSMQGNIYEIMSVYAQTLLPVQLLELFNFSRYDVNGNFKGYKAIPSIDPYQFQNSLYFKVKSKEYFLDGRTSILYNVYSNQSVIIHLETKTFNRLSMLPDVNDSNIRDFLQTYLMYDSYQL